MRADQDWAEETFGGASLGDHRRTRRLVRVARSFAERPSGRVTEVIHDPAAREAAFRFVENDAIDPQAIARAAQNAAARRCAGEDLVIVPMDESTLTLTDHTGGKGFGRTGTTAACQWIERRGFQVMTAIAVSGSGVGQGIIGQDWWTRLAASPDWKRDRRPIEQRESVLWTRVMVAAARTLREHAPGARPWFQLDRGGDATHVLQLAADEGLLITVRAAHSRVLAGGGYTARKVARQPVAGRYCLAVPARNGRRSRVATLSVRFAPVVLRLAHQCTGRATATKMFAVEVREISYSGASKPLHWRLLTSREVTSFADALVVIDAYTKRWRVEDLHRAWKTGTCNIERSQLRSAAAFRRWATIAAAVAARAEQLKTLSRAEPHRPALGIFSRAEIDATIVLSLTKAHRVGDDLSLEQAVFLVACVGGYIGKHARTTPGVLTISRGLDRVVTGAAIFTALNR